MKLSTPNPLQHGILMIFLFLAGINLQGQEMISGPIISKYGATYQIPDPELLLSGPELRVVFDITGASEDPDSINSQINTIARCINMHANTGVSTDQMRIAAVFHSLGTYAVLNDKAYSRKFGTENVNSSLLAILSDLGVDLYVCGQSVYSRGLEKTDLHSDVKMALSAMSALIHYQNNGYALIKF